MLFFYLLDKYCELVYTSCVVNREVIRNVVDDIIENASNRIQADCGDKQNMETLEELGKENISNANVGSEADFLYFT